MLRSCLFTALVPIALGSCATPSPAEEAGLGASSIIVEDGSIDPVVHLQVIADAAMEGRGTPSPGLQRAADYVVTECRKAGVVGAMSDGGFFQPFTIGGFPVASIVAPEPDTVEFGSDLFEEGVFLSGRTSTETRKEMGKQLCQAMTAAGDVCPPGIMDGTVDPRPFVQAIAAAQQTNNVVGLLPGSGPHKDEIVLLSAHLDHLGKTSQGVFPGADDNGSGSSTLVALMHRLSQAARMKPLDRTIAFFWTAGEEKGLLGASYFVDNAPSSIPLAQVKQVINMDMVGGWDDTRFSIGVDAAPNSQVSARLFDAANAELDRPFARINRDVQSYNRRQDGYAFSRGNIATIFVFEGLANPAGGGGLMPRYHKTTDTVESLLAESGGSKIRRMADVLDRFITKVADAELAAAPVAK